MVFIREMHIAKYPVTFQWSEMRINRVFRGKMIQDGKQILYSKITYIVLNYWDLWFPGPLAVILHFVKI